MKKLVLDSYARESKRGDDRNLSVSGQHDENAKRIEELGATLGRRLQDRGRSAWQPGVTREDWEKLIKRMERKESDGAVIFDLSRLLRRVEDAVRIVKVAENGARIYDSEMEYDLLTPSGQQAFYYQAVAHQNFSHRLSTKIKRGYRTKAKRGEGKTGSYRPLGFDHDPIEKTIRVNPIERDYIRHIVKKILATEDPWTWEDAARWLNDQGCLTGAGNKWVGVSLRTAVRTPRMAGLIMLDGEIAGEMKEESILTKIEWQRLLQHIQSRRGRPPTGTYLCTGKKSPVRCSCGGQLTGKTDSHKRRYVDDESFDYLGPKQAQEREQELGIELPPKREYWCPKRSGGCGKLVVDHRVMDAIASDVAVRIMSDPGYPAQVQRALEAGKSKRAPLLAELERLNSLLAHWDEKLNEGTATLERHTAMTGDVERRIAETKKALEGMEEADFRVPPENAAEVAQGDWEAAQPEERKRMLFDALRLSGLQLLIEPGSVLDMDIASVGERVTLKPIVTPVPGTADA